MEKALEKLAEQLNSLDEASLVKLFDRYEAVVRQFRPGRNWERAVLVLSMIQAVRWKNQLFNHHWKELHGPSSDDPPEPEPDREPTSLSEQGKGRVLRFPGT